MALFYGVAGEGMGHATRSEVIIRSLIDNHKIVAFSYSRAYEHLKKINHPNLEVVRIKGIKFTYEHNEFKLGKTVISESKKVRHLLVENLRTYIRKIREHNPPLFINDFEPSMYSVSKLASIPMITIDNVGFIAKCDVEVPGNRIKGKLWSIMSNIVGDFNYVTTLFDVPLREKYRENTLKVGPILREAIQKSKVSQKDHILVYQTSDSNDHLQKVIAASTEKYVVYGFNKNSKRGNLTYKRWNTDTFFEDLHSAKAVICNGGYSLLSEAAYLEKPIFSIPVNKQIEQQLNAYYLEKSGFGETADTLTRKQLDYFLHNLPRYRKTLKAAAFTKNGILLHLPAKMEELMDKESSRRAKLLLKL